MYERKSLTNAGQKPIALIMTDDTQLLVSPKVFDVLLESHRVKKFKRSTGWVTVGIDPVRSRPRIDTSYLYDGPEKRAM